MTETPRVAIFTGAAGGIGRAMRPNRSQVALVISSTDECGRSGDDAPGAGSHHQRDYQPRHDVECRLSNVRTVQGGARGAQRHYGEGPRWHRGSP